MLFKYLVYPPLILLILLLWSAQPLFAATDIDALHQQAAAGSTDAQTGLGWMYENGHGVAQDIEPAVFWYKKAAKPGSPKAKKYLARLQTESAKKSTVADTSKQIHGLPPKQEAQLSEQTITDTEPKADQSGKQSIKELQQAAEQGDENAQVALAQSLLGKKASRHDYHNAAFWFNKAATQGNVVAQNNLGQMYINGIGVEKDLPQAFFWLHKAAAQGERSAQNNIGVMYANGTGVEQNRDQAISWLLKAAEQGYGDAQYNLAKMYYSNPAQPQDRTNTIYWLQKAAKQDHRDAQYDLASMYFNGQGVETDVNKSIYWLRKATAQGDEEADRMLAAIENELHSDQTSDAAALTDISKGTIVTPSNDSHTQRKAAEYFYRANNFAQDGKFALAITEYKKAIEFDPQNANTHENIGIVYSQNNMHANAVEAMNTAIRLSPGDADKVATLGVILHANNDLDAALSHYIKALNLNPGLGWVYNKMAMIYLSRNEYTNGWKCAQLAQALGHPEQDIMDILVQKAPGARPVTWEAKPDAMHLRQIVVSSPTKAEKILHALQNGGDFMQLASKNSPPEYSMNGGYMGLVDNLDLANEIAEMVEALPPFGFSPVVKADDMYKIFQKLQIDPELLATQ